MHLPAGPCFVPGKAVPSQDSALGKCDTDNGAVTMINFPEENITSDKYDLQYAYVHESQVCTSNAACVRQSCFEAYPINRWAHSNEA